jgi:hypothetical protein
VTVESANRSASEALLAARILGGLVERDDLPGLGQGLESLELGHLHFQGGGQLLGRRLPFQLFD